ncbi:nucleotide sugar dehydrogenase [Candidatus Peregrinibacteria bacterium]|nr:MAG: nucleotide sugar dehydrogenase [Candidatus Peregrinibacteria bacterium]
MQRVSVIGLGYVGLPLLCILSEKEELSAHGFDINSQKIAMIQKRESPFSDAFISEFFQKNGLSISEKEEILKESDVFVICVPTPVQKDFSPDYEPLLMASETVAKYLRKGNLVLVESTINPGVCEEMIVPLLEQKTKLLAGKDFDLAHCPERVNPGDTKWTLRNIPRNVGGITENSCQRAAIFYRSFLEGEIHEQKTIREAEATKVVENTFRDINIAYVNELAKSFDRIGIDLVSVLRGAANKPFGFLAHFPGCGVGGHCIPVDPYYLIREAEKSGLEHSFLRRAREINNSMPEYTVSLLVDALNDCHKSIRGTRIGILGISYKAEVGDIRNSPAMHIRDILEEKGAEVQMYDSFLSEVSDKKNTAEILEYAEAILIATNHKEFRALSPEDFLRYDIGVVIDGKNIFPDPKCFWENGISYRGIGRGNPSSPA